MNHPKRPRDPNQLAKSIIDICDGAGCRTGSDPSTLQQAPANLAQVSIIVRQELLVATGAVDVDMSPAYGLTALRPDDAYSRPRTGAYRAGSKKPPPELIQ
jgi:hypothetical protein